MNMQVQTINGLRPTDVWFLANPRYSTTKQWQALIGSGLLLCVGQRPSRANA